MDNSTTLLVAIMFVTLVVTGIDGYEKREIGRAHV